MGSHPSRRSHRSTWTVLAALLVCAMMASEVFGVLRQVPLRSGDRVRIMLSRSTIAYDRQRWPVVGSIPTWQFGTIGDPQSGWPRPIVPMTVKTAAATVVRIPLWPAAALMCGLTVWAWWGAWRCDPTRCGSCRYDLTGLTGQFCPECGSRLASCDA